MRINISGLNLIKSYEGLELKAYKCPADVWTIGYGHTGVDVYEGQEITEQEAEELLKKDLEKFENGVKKLLKTEVNENQYSALVSFAYNVGLGNLKLSTLLKKVNAREFKDAAEEFLKWNKAGGRILKGLTRRREAERRLFLS